jgi:DNA-binding response OmpR family regulator
MTTKTAAAPHPSFAAPGHRPNAHLRVLVVESDPAARDLLVGILRHDGYQVHTAPDSPSTIESAKTLHPDLALVAGRLRGGHGDEIAHGLRCSGDVAIIFVTAADSADDIVSGFKVGADDYVVKPFNPVELCCRVRAVLRRYGHGMADMWECGDLVVDYATRRCTRAGTPISLTTTEFNLLGVLMRNRARVVPIAQLLDQVWAVAAAQHTIDDDAARHTLGVHISTVRRKLEAHGSSRMIQTVRGTGYILRP